MSNGNAAAAVLLTAAILTGMSHAHGRSARRHVARPWSKAERVELGDTRIPVRSVRGPAIGERRVSRSQRSYQSYQSHPVELYRDSRRPVREQVPEVIVGYLDPARGSAAFHRLTKVAEGDRVKVVRRDHSIAWFRVDSVRRMVRRSIAEERVASGRPELRLISVRGGAGHAGGDQPKDLVVSAHLDGPGQPAG